MKILLLFILIFYLKINKVILLINNNKTICSIECYKKCLESGTPIADYCNCLEIDNNCELINNKELFNNYNEKTIENLNEFKSGYLNIKIIWLNFKPIPNAFIYIFEFSDLNSDVPVWIFAGTSYSPQINYLIPDYCKEYQFRLIVILRSTNPQLNLIIFKEKQIPFQLPQFIVSDKSIYLDLPKQSNDGQTLYISLNWKNPLGYEDEDILGYSLPTAYPINCLISEEKISQPFLELIKGEGARLNLALPIDILKEKCQIYLEIKILPKCERIKPFDIQISTEFDCQKFSNLEYCKKEQPECTQLIDLWGNNDGRATIVWQKPNNNLLLLKPNYYIINWGPITQNQNSSSIFRKIINGQQIKVPGNITKIELTPQWGIIYGLQICAFYFEEKEKINKLNIPIIPFICNHCLSEIKKERCIECSKIEQRQSPLNIKSSQEQIPIDCIGELCYLSNYSSTTTHFITSGIV